MSTNPSEYELSTPDIDPLAIAPMTIEQYEGESHDIAKMYDALHATHPELAEYLRKRAVQLSPRVAERVPRAQLALEIVELISRQQTTSHEIHTLESQYMLELVPEMLGSAAESEPAEPHLGNNSYSLTSVATANLPSEGPPMKPELAQPSTKHDPRELGERLFAALRSEERAARLIFASFDETAPPARGATRREASTRPYSYEALREAAIARLLLEHFVEEEPKQIAEQWRAELPPLPETNQ